MANAKSYTDHLLEEQQKAQNTPAPAADATPSAAPGYADYLAGLAKATGGGQKQVVSAAPAPAGQGYADWLVTMQKNHTVENTPTNAMSYADYLLYMGSDPAGDYKAKVEDANKTYAGAVHSHGKNKEAMVASGLAGSGYGEYLVSTAYAERARAIENAQSVAKAGMEQGKKSYADYLVDLRAENEKAAYTGIVTGQLTGEAARKFAIDKGVTEDRLDVILGQASSALAPTFEQNAVNGILQQGLTGDAAKEYARQQGVAEDRIEAVVGQTAATVEANALAKEQAEAQNADAALNQLFSLMSEEGGNMSFSTAIETMKGGTYKDYIDAITNRYRNVQLHDIRLALKEGYAVAGTKGRLEGLLKQGVIGESTYHEELGKIVTHNGELVKKLLTGDLSVISAYAEAYGLGVPRDAAGANAVIDHMASEGVIDQEIRQNYYKTSHQKTIDEKDNSAVSLANAMDIVGRSFEAGQLTEDSYKELLQSIGNKSEDMYGKPEHNWGTEFDGFADGHYICINYDQGHIGNEGIDINYELCGEVSGEGFVEGKSASANGNRVVFGTINGKMAIFYRGKYYINNGSMYSETEHNSAYMVYMCTPSKMETGG